MSDSNNRAVQRLTSGFTSFERIEESVRGVGYTAHIARQYMELYVCAKGKSNPTILELGTRDGVSTKIFLQACMENGGHVVSVDIDDCSHVASGQNWTFVQSDSTDVRFILKNAQILENGIDILLIDSLHLRKHVEKELYSWYPYMKKGSLIIFDDVDPFNYRKGRRKDNVSNEFIWQSIQDFVIELFRADEDNLRLKIVYGSSGLAIMEKHAPIGAEAIKPGKQIYRDRELKYKILVRLSWIKGRVFSWLRQWRR